MGTYADLQAIAVKTFERRHLVGSPLPVDGWSKPTLGQWAADRFWQASLHEGKKSILSFPMIGRLAELLLRVNPMARDALRLTVISNAVEWWPSLSRLERDVLVDTLTRDSSDGIWRQAVALTRREVPDEIENVLLPPGARFRDGHVQLRSQLPELFNACFAVATGYPSRFEAWQKQPNSKFWQDAIVAIARNPTDPLFDGAFELVLARSTELNPGIEALILAATAIDADAVFQHLLKRTIFDGPRHRKEFWTFLLRAVGPSKDLSQWINEMADVAQHVLERATSSADWIADPEIRKSLDERLADDLTIYMMLDVQVLADKTEKALGEGLDADEDDENEEADNDPETLAEGYAGLIVRVMGLRQPRFLATIDDALRVFKHLDVSKAIVEALEAEREVLSPIFLESYRQATRSKPSERPAGWVSGFLE